MYSEFWDKLEKKVSYVRTKLNLTLIFHNFRRIALQENTELIIPLMRVNHGALQIYSARTNSFWMKALPN